MWSFAAIESTFPRPIFKIYSVASDPLMKVMIN